MYRLIQPHTDLGVLIQVVLLVIAVAALAWRVRGHADLLRLTLGGGVFVGGLFVLRAMH